MGTVSNSSKLDLNLTPEMNNIGRMPFNEDGIANLFGMNDSTWIQSLHGFRGRKLHFCQKKMALFENSLRLTAVYIFMIFGMMIFVLKNQMIIFQLRMTFLCNHKKRTASGTQNDKLARPRKLKTCVR